jgi:hypothetical protein
MESAMPRIRATKLSYKDVEPVWNAVLNNDRLTYKFHSRTDCTQTIQRLNQYRVLDRADWPDQQSPLDKYIIRRLDETTIRIEPRAVRGTLINDYGEIIDIDLIQQQTDAAKDEKYTTEYKPDAKKPLIDMD